MANNDSHDLYAAGRTDLIGQLRSLDADQAATIVPTCPDWTVKDVAAHLSGLVTEALSDVPPPYGSPEATARQVGDRADKTLAEICDEWEANGPAFAEHAIGEPAFATALVADLAVHHHDIAEALDLPIDEKTPGTIAAAERYLEILQERAADKLDIALTVELVDAGVRPASAGSRQLTLTVSPVDFLRNVTGRRTQADAKALDWTGDPTDLLATAFYQYQTPG